MPRDGRSGRPLRFARPTHLLLEPEDIGHVLVSYGTYAKTDRLTDGRGRRAVGGGVLVAREGIHRDKRRTVRHASRHDGSSASASASLRTPTAPSTDGRTAPPSTSRARWSVSRET